MGLSFAFAITYVVVMTYTLPKTDLAYGQTPFQDPVVFPVMLFVAGISGLVAWPLFAVLGWYSPPLTVAKITGLTTLFFIMVATPIQPGIGLFGAYIVCLGGLVYCSVRHRSTDGQRPAGDNAASPHAQA